MTTSSEVRAVTVDVNGTSRQLPEGSTIASLLDQLALRPELVAVERNRELVRRVRFGETLLAAGDRIEIVEFVGGG
ncbi:MAG TPA: sulfur carrier protein ThiS [Thermoanaerobaculia bacterium]|nr:sulfur carrier protein ThiS [Thermoanaerobaculia bacterium]